MQKKKVALSGAVIASLLAVSVGCGSKEAATSPSPSAAATPTPASTAAATPAATPAGSTDTLKGDFEIQYFVGGYGDAWWKKMVEEFGKLHPNLKIKQSAGPKINDQMQPRWIQGDPPDVVYIDGAGSNEAQMVKDDQLLDITDWFKGAKNADGKQISDLLIAKPIDYSGKTFTIPLVFGSWGTFYDKAWFKEKGWKTPTDFQSFMEVSKTIKDAGIKPYIHTGMYPYYISGGFLDSAIISENGGDASILKKIEALDPTVFSSDPFKKALDKLAQIRDAGFIDPASVGINHTDSQMLFLQHKDAFIPNGLWVENEMKANIPAGFTFGFIPSIAQDAGKPSVVVPYTSQMAIAKKSKNPEAAKAFVQYILTEKSAVQWAELAGVPMNLKADLESSKAGAMAKDAAKSFNDKNTIVAPVIAVNKDYEKVRNDALVAFTQKKITADEVIKRLVDVANKAKK
ncbi:extracellular solute-binding protein [Paenibacillus sp. N1-5-1-14]|uniref:extracellular solute-binding protein n=1 Tax=Paenibacillus radicibacter TaxID=2972488 RepID=UPI002158E57D|nr:extracellular solute-binding protein [Paenibacillus radicibacter]MCR8643699.1 extracellular solute-binding protein [Paenibacillus radicibacter]